MFEFFFGFGRSRRSRNEDTKIGVLTERGSAKSKKNERQREMIQLALNTVLRRRGLSSQVLGCELVLMPRVGAADVMLTQLVMHEWQEGLMRDAPDLQNELFDEIHRFDGSVRGGDFLFVWKLAFGGRTALAKVREPHQVAQRPAPRSPAPGLALVPGLAGAAIARAAVKFDLPRSALDREDIDHDHGFAATLIASR